MSNKTVDFVLVAIIILTFCTYFFIRYQINSQYDLIQQLEKTEQFILEENWDDAKESSLEVQNIWSKHRFILMVNYAEADITTIEEYINLLVGGTISEDMVTSLSSTYYIKDLWTNMQKLVPQP